LEIFVDDETKLTLHGLQQHYVKLQESEKNRKLVDLLDALEFNQVCIFVKSVARANELNKLLSSSNFPSTCIHSGMSQEERISRFKSFKEFNKRIMVATDIFGRGIDIERVNIVINYDMPESADSYLHRVNYCPHHHNQSLINLLIFRWGVLEDLVQKDLPLHLSLLLKMSRYYRVFKRDLK